MTDLNLIPTVELWKLADAEPNNHTLQQAAETRKDQLFQIWKSNGRDGKLYYNPHATLFDWVWPPGRDA